MKRDQFKNLSCYEEFEIQCTLTGILKIDVLKEIGHRIDDYYFFVSLDGIFNWFDLEGNHIEDPGVLTELRAQYISKNIIRCVIPDAVYCINDWTFYDYNSLKEIAIPNFVTNIGDYAFTACKALTEISIPDFVTSIGYYAFYGCTSLKHITIPNSVTNIGYDAFYLCESLIQVVFKGKTLEEVKQMTNYPFGIKDESTIKCEKMI